MPVYVLLNSAEDMNVNWWDCTLRTSSVDLKPSCPLWVGGTCWSNDRTSVCEERISMLGINCFCDTKLTQCNSKKARQSIL